MIICILYIYILPIFINSNIAILAHGIMIVIK